ncbi:C39 family peptidase [Rubrivivax gelatinosus]|uniref:Peptidase C39 family protein n=1 Tax=Rubrivivax gelatinosus (strain NBRC 100245 / IL144) TaxID=983917 RepID=I0HQS0_RUBGI|nr:C39 family peptidase [Rubrivivax gelatinosus]BAL95357.1 peptidase C39 family protein [Rubrivivax gelatinosus IL144]
MTRIRPLVLAAWIGLAAAAARAGSVELPVQISGAYQVPVQSLKERRFGAMVRQQYDYSCGAAALSTLLSFHYGRAVPEQAVFEEMFVHGDADKIRREGFSLLDMKRYLEAHGYEANGYRATIDRLVGFGAPAIALVNESGYNHFVVIKGVRGERMLIGDPSGGLKLTTRERFEASWVNGVLFVITSHKDRASFNAASDWGLVAQAPMADGVNRDGLGALVLPKLGSSDF